MCNYLFLFFYFFLFVLIFSYFFLFFSYFSTFAGPAQIVTYQIVTSSSELTIISNNNIMQVLPFAVETYVFYSIGARARRGLCRVGFASSMTQDLMDDEIHNHWACTQSVDEFLWLPTSYILVPYLVVPGLICVSVIYLSLSSLSLSQNGLYEL